MALRDVAGPLDLPRHRMFEIQEDCELICSHYLQHKQTRMYLGIKSGSIRNYLYTLLSGAGRGSTKLVAFCIEGVHSVTVDIISGIGGKADGLLMGLAWLRDFQWGDKKGVVGCIELSFLRQHCAM